MKLGILLLFSLICCLYSTPASALALSTASSSGSTAFQNDPPLERAMSLDGTETPEQHLQLAYKSVRCGVFSLFLLVGMVVLLGLTWNFVLTFILGILPGVLLGARAIMLGLKVLKRAKGYDPVSRKARSKAMLGIVLGGFFSFLFLALTWGVIYLTIFFD